MLVIGNTLTFQGKTYRCAVGKNGFSADKKEGDSCTPIGTFALRECWFRADRLSAPNTQLPLRAITKNDGWCDDPESSEYNRYLKLPLPLGEGRGEGFYHYLKPELIQKARELRHQSTTPEQKLWAILRNRQLGGYKFRRQHPISPYVADFCCEEIKMIVEVDGESHFSEEAMIDDARRTAYLQQLGYQTVRFTNQEIMTNLEGVYEALTLTLSQREREQLQKPALPLGAGRGEGYENLWRADHVYDLIIPLGYNDDPIIKGKGSAIFMHIAKPDYSGTEGCVALAQQDLLDILPALSINTHIQIQASH